MQKCFPFSRMDCLLAIHQIGPTCYKGFLNSYVLSVNKRFFLQILRDSKKMENMKKLNNIIFHNKNIDILKTA